MSMTGTIERVEVITSVRRRRWSTEEKAAIVQETYVPETSVSLVACRQGCEPAVPPAGALCRGRMVGGRRQRICPKPGGEPRDG